MKILNQKFIVGFISFLLLCMSQSSIAANKYALFLVDETGSMKNNHGSSSYTMWEDATFWASMHAYDFYRTVAREGHTPYFKLVTFNSFGVYKERTGWVGHFDFSNELMAIESETPKGNTPLAESLCLAGDDFELITDVDSDFKTVFYLTDGNENDSTGPCSGSNGYDLSNPSLWTTKVINKLANSAKFTVDVFGDVDPTLLSPRSLSKYEMEGADSELVNKANASNNSKAMKLAPTTSELNFFKQLTSMTGGKLTIHEPRIGCSPTNPC